MPGADAALPTIYSVGNEPSRDSLDASQLGAAQLPPPESPPDPVVDSVTPLSRKLSNTSPKPAMRTSSDSVQSGAMFRTVTNVEVLPPDQVKSMQAVFDIFDTSRDGIVQANEIGAVLRRLNLITSRRMIRTIIEIVDIDGDGEIDFGEFVTLMARVKEEVEEESEPEAPDDDMPLIQLTAEEKKAKADRQAALSAFQRAVTMMAFTHQSNNDAEMMTELLKVLETDPIERTEWELQRLLLWAENYKKEGRAEVGFKFIKDLPPPEESDVRIEVCRCMGVERFEEGKDICVQGEKGECMYVIMEGEVQVLAVLPDGREEHLAYMGSGNSIGELAVMSEDEADALRYASEASSGKWRGVKKILREIWVPVWILGGSMGI